MGKQTRATSKQPLLHLTPDDNVSACSDLEVTIFKPLGRVNVKHITQGGSVNIFQLYPYQLEALSEFLLQSKAWIESGYKDKEKPKSKSEDYGGRFT